MEIRLKPENIFVILSLLTGLLFVFINPPFQTPDEAQHMFKMWGFTNKTFNFKVLNKYTGDVLPDSLIQISKFDRMCRHAEIKTSPKEIITALKIKLEKDKTSFYAFTPTSYTPVSYFPLFLILWALKLVSAPPLIMLYMLRLTALFLYTGLGYQAVKCMPFKKWLFVLLMLLPMTLYEAASATADPLTMGIAFLFIAYTLKLAYDENITRLGKKELAGFGLLITLLLMCKYAYFPFLLLYFVIPKKKFSSAKVYYLYFALLALLNAVLIAVFINHLTNIAQGVIAGAPGYDKKFMISFILHRFSWFMDYVFKTASAYTIPYFYSYIGLLGCNDAPMPFFALNFYAVLLFASSIIKTDKEEPGLRFKDKMVFAVIFLLSSLVIFASAFILFQCYPLICGVQGRYFIPLMPLFFFLFDNKKIIWTKYHVLLILCLLILVPFPIYTLVHRFY